MRLLFARATNNVVYILTSDFHFITRVHFNLTAEGLNILRQLQPGVSSLRGFIIINILLLLLLLFNLILLLMLFNYYHYYLLLLWYFYVYFIFSFIFASLCIISGVVVS